MLCQGVPDGSPDDTLVSELVEDRCGSCAFQILVQPASNRTASTQSAALNPTANNISIGNPTVHASPSISNNANNKNTQQVFILPAGPSRPTVVTTTPSEPTEFAKKVGLSKTLTAFVPRATGARARFEFCGPRGAGHPVVCCVVIRLPVRCAFWCRGGFDQR